jgi:hypothetical protein
MYDKKALIKGDLFSSNSHKPKSKKHKKDSKYNQR